MSLVLQEFLVVQLMMAIVIITALFVIMKVRQAIKQLGHDMATL